MHCNCITFLLWSECSLLLGVVCAVFLPECRLSPLSRNSLFLSFAAVSGVLGAVTQKQHPILTGQGFLLTLGLLVLLLLSHTHIFNCISFIAVLKNLLQIY